MVRAILRLAFRVLGIRNVSDPTTAKKDEGEKIVVLPFCSHKNHKIENYINLELVKTKFYQNIVMKLSKIRVWDPVSEIRDPERTYSGSRT
jgi:hypothetical protein